jgi:dihydroxyacetone kinase
VNALRECVLAAADALEAARASLGELDGVAGDGDHGTTMTLAARETRKRLAAQPAVDGAQLLTVVAGAMGSVGGAIGPIYATGLLRVARQLRERGDAQLTTATLTACAEAAEEGVTTLGGAEPGDKTLLDALHPLVEELRAATARGDDPLAAAQAASEACRRGATATAQMVASVGRASRLGERSRGWADPGATSLALVVDALVDTVAKNSGGQVA